MRHNSISLEEQIIAELSPIKITRYAFEKANYISTRICEIAGRPLEIGFYFLDEPINGREPDIVIRDVYIGQEQTVEHLHCDITSIGDIRSFKDIKSMKKRIVGWGHSHADIGTFYSGEDDNTILNKVRKWGIKKELDLAVDLSCKPGYNIEYFSDGDKKGLLVTVKDETVFINSTIFQDHSDSYNQKQIFEMIKDDKIKVPFFYGMTFNAANDEPHCVVAYILDQRPYKVEKGVKYSIVDPKEERAIDKNLIDNELLSRIIELRQIRSDFEGGMEKEFAHFKKQYVAAAKAINFLASHENISLKKEKASLSELCGALQEEIETLDRYDPEKNAMIVADNPSHMEYNAKINSFWNELMDKASATKPVFEKRLEEISSESQELPFHKMSARIDLKNIYKMYSDIIGIIESHGISKEGVKDDSEGQ